MMSANSALDPPLTNQLERFTTAALDFIGPIRRNTDSPARVPNRETLRHGCLNVSRSAPSQ